MILKTELKKDKKGNILSKKADYNPSQEVKDRTAQVLKDFAISNTIRNEPFAEFNYLSLLDRMNLDQMSWNQFVEGASADPAEAWRSRAFRPVVRNKIITIAAHITAAVIYPVIYAQNKNDDSDKDAAQVMRDLMEWANNQAKYDQTFMYAVIAALVNPASIIHTEYSEKFREIKVGKKEDGTYDIKKVVDEIFSGFQDSIVPCDELYISNAYEHDIQKQPYLIWRKVIDYATAETKYGSNETFKEYVKPGVQFLYSDDQQMFYEEYDQDLQGRLVEEVIYYNRNADLKLTFVNGILLDDVGNPNPRKDKLYPFAKGGYELIDEGKFFYYKSLAFKLAPDEEVVNTLYRMIIDGSYLQIMPPSVIFGNEEIGSSVVAPGMVTNISLDNNPNAAFQTVNTNNNLTAGFNTMNMVEKSINESSADIMQTGQAMQGEQTAYEIARLEQNARVMLGLFGKMIGFMVRDFGYLRMGDILQFLTVGQVMDIESEAGALKFRNFVLPEKTVKGKTKTKKIEFDMDLPDESTEEENEMINIELAQKASDLGDDVEIVKVNPGIFRELKFKVHVVPEPKMPQSDAMQKALQLEEYAMAIQNPLIDGASITKDLLLGSFDKTKDDPERYMKKAQPQMTQPPVEGGEQISKAIMEAEAPQI